jgi:TPR repeat protein
LVLNGIDAERNKEMCVDCLRRASDQGLIPVQLYFATLLREGRVIDKNAVLSAHYFKLAADQGSTKGQIEYTECIFHLEGVPVSVQRHECERYLRLVLAQCDSKAQMKLGTETGTLFQLQLFFVMYCQRLIVR